MSGSHRHFAQRESRRFRCPCPQCGNLIYNCPFTFKYQHAGPLPVFELACEEPVVAQKPDPARCDLEEYCRVVAAFNAEYRACMSTTTIGEVLAKTAKRLGSTYKQWHASSAVCQTALRALSGYAMVERNPAAAVRVAEEALSLCTVCPDAYALLARLKAKSLEEALELYERGVLEPDKVMSPDGIARCATAYGKCTAASPPYMGVVRCMEGSIYTLCRLRRPQEAYTRLMKLLSLCPPLKEQPALSAWVLAPEVVFRARGPAGCLSWMNKHLCSEAFEWGGGEVWWIATYALAWTATHKEEGFMWTSLSSAEDETNLTCSHGARGCCNDDEDDDEDSGDGSDSDSSSGGGRACKRRGGGAGKCPPVWRGACDKLRNGMALAACCCWLPMMVDMLLGDMPVPSGPLPPMAVAAGSVGCQVGYVRCCGDLWRDTPGVLEYVRRFRNTYEVFGIISDARSGANPNMRDFRRYMGLSSSPSSPSSPAPSAGPSPRPPAAGSGPTTATTSSSPSSSSSAATGATRAASSSSSSSAAIFPDAVKFEGMCCWHGLVELAATFTTHHLNLPDPTMNAVDLEILQELVAAGCPIKPHIPHNKTAGGRVSTFSPLLYAMYRGYGPDAVRLLLKAGADPLLADRAECVPLVCAAEQGMWRELQAVFKIKRKLGSMPVPPKPRQWVDFSCDMALPLCRNVFELTLLTAFQSPFLACVTGVKRGCQRCTKDKRMADAASPHGPWASFSKLLEVLVAYGMTSVHEPLRRWMWQEAERVQQPLRTARRNLLTELDRVLREAKERQEGNDGKQSAQSSSAKEAQEGSEGKQSAQSSSAKEAQKGSEGKQSAQSSSAKEGQEGNEAKMQKQGKQPAQTSSSSAAASSQPLPADKTTDGVGKGTGGDDKAANGATQEGQQKRDGQRSPTAEVRVKAEAPPAAGAVVQAAKQQGQQQQAGSPPVSAAVSSSEQAKTAKMSPAAQKQDPPGSNNNSGAAAAERAVKGENGVASGAAKKSSKAAQEPPGAAPKPAPNGTAAAAGAVKSVAGAPVVSAAASVTPTPPVPAAAAPPSAAAAASEEEELILEPYQDKSHCWCCGKAKDRAAGIKPRKCAKCLTARYCGEACQRQHWPTHRPQCSLLATRALQKEE
ncbi:hypothetical protein Agub_g10551 [Astrephomene gubernaculifera]|uniref:MYND-type domain-containing protein n=1 Tax=Astrephomene gubernaculifera TaxID=47775 RepID=A0AAD3HQ83_9CHLO|nr:hypothetical protein Agub_g10551 [Astrephomene gubernaculifera]